MVTKSCSVITASSDPHLNSPLLCNPSAEYLQDKADAVPCANRFENPPNHSVALKLHRYRVKTMRESVAQFENIVESSPVADAIIDAIALPGVHRTSSHYAARVFFPSKKE
jgi:hypothetical protein